MKIEKFEDIVSWQKSKELSLKVYSSFKENKDFNFKGQIERASVSVMNNIAEGFERRSNQEFKYFLFIAKGSCAEVRSMLYIAHELKYIEDKSFEELRSLAIEVSKLLSGLIKKL